MIIFNQKLSFRSLFLFLILTVPAVAAAAGFRGEVMALQGDAFVISDLSRASAEKGQLVASGDSLETGASSFIDIGFDSGWKNVMRVGENSTVKITDIYPTSLSLVGGEILAKLDALPKDSTFEIKTPTAVIGIRGSMCLAEHKDGVTTASNLHAHPIFVAPPANGSVLDSSKMQSVGLHEKATVGSDLKVTVDKMTAAEIGMAAKAVATLTASVTQRSGEGSSVKLEDISQISSAYQDGLDVRLPKADSPADTSASYETDILTAGDNAAEAPHQEQRAGGSSSGGSTSGGADGGDGGGDGLSLETSIATEEAVI